MFERNYGSVCIASTLPYFFNRKDLRQEPTLAFHPMMSSPFLMCSAESGKSDSLSVFLAVSRSVAVCVLVVWGGLLAFFFFLVFIGGSCDVDAAFSFSSAFSSTVRSVSIVTGGGRASSSSLWFIVTDENKAKIKN